MQGQSNVQRAEDEAASIFVRQEGCMEEETLSRVLAAVLAKPFWIANCRLREAPGSKAPRVNCVSATTHVALVLSSHVPGSERTRDKL